ncbi:hypothetical protein HN51_055564, partial [Arachis hypogaea]
MLHAASPAPGFCLSYPRNLHCPRDSTEPSIRARSPVCCSVPETKNGATKVGFEVIDSISKAERIQMNTIQSKALIGIDSIGDVPILLAKPQTYMNFSSES